MLDDFLTAYMGKMYEGDWDEQGLGGLEGMYSPYELMQMMSEEVLSGSGRERKMLIDGDILHEKFGDKHRSRLDASEEWFLGQMLYLLRTSR